MAREAQGNARAGTPADATKDANTLLLAVHWSRIDDALEQAGDLSGKIILTCSLHNGCGATPNSSLVPLHPGAEQLAKKVPQALVVCNFNTVPSDVLFRVFEARDKKPPPSEPPAQ